MRVLRAAAKRGDELSNVLRTACVATRLDQGRAEEGADAAITLLFATDDLAGIDVLWTCDLISGRNGAIRGMAKR